MDYQSPNRADAHRALLRAANDLGSEDTAEDIRQLLRGLNAPSTLRGFLWLAATRLSPLVAIAIDLCPEDLGPQFEAFRRALDWIEENRTHLVSVLPKSALHVPKTGVHCFMLGHGAERHALYAALGTSAQHDAHIDLHDRLAALYWVAHVNAICNYVPLAAYEEYAAEEEIPGIPNSPYPSSLGLRRLALAESSGDLHLLPSGLTIEGLFGLDLDEIHSPHLIPVLKWMRRAIAGDWSDHIGVGHGGGGRRQRLPPGYTRQGINGFVASRVTADQDDPNFEGDDTEDVMPSTSEAESDAAYDDDYHPQEVHQNRRCIQVTPACKDVRVSAANARMAADAKAQYLAMASQNLFSNYMRLTGEEIGRVLSLARNHGVAA